MVKPSNITYHRKSKVLEVCFGKEHQFNIPTELLRVFSPSAEVRGHGAGERKLQPGKKYVGITSIEPVGNYAIRLLFDDGHDSGLYTWELLQDMGVYQDNYWQDYLEELKVANASRLPTIPVGQWQPKE